MTKEIFGLLIIVVLLVVGFAFYQFQTPKVEVEPEIKEEEKIEGVSLMGGSYVADVASSTLLWEGRKTLIAGYTDTGSISLKEGGVKVENNQIMTGQFLVDMTSITASSTGKGNGQDMLTKHLKSVDFFDVVKFATSSLSVNSVEMLGGQYIAFGDLTIKGKTNSVEFPVVLAQDGINLSVTGEAVIDRTKWDIRYGSNKFFDNLADNVIDDKFTLKFDIKLKRVDEVVVAPSTATSTATTTVGSTATTTASTTKSR